MELKFYKKGQGTVIRITAWIALSLVILYGAISLYKTLPKIDIDKNATFWGNPLFKIPFFEFPVTPALLISTAVLLLGVAGVYLFVINKPASVDFLIETEVELRKVSWPPRYEYLGASLAVIISVVFFSLFIYGADNVLQLVLRLIGLR